MIDSKWTHLTADEAAISLNALSSIRGSQHADIAKIDMLIDKLENAESEPNIIIGIELGQVAGRAEIRSRFEFAIMMDLICPMLMKAESPAR